MKLKSRKYSIKKNHRLTKNRRRWCKNMKLFRKYALTTNMMLKAFLKASITNAKKEEWSASHEDLDQCQYNRITVREKNPLKNHWILPLWAV